MVALQQDGGWRHQAGEADVIPLCLVSNPVPRLLIIFVVQDQVEEEDVKLVELRDEALVGESSTPLVPLTEPSGLSWIHPAIEEAVFKLTFP